MDGREGKVAGGGETIERRLDLLDSNDGQIGCMHGGEGEKQKRTERDSGVQLAANGNRPPNE